MNHLAVAGGRADRPATRPATLVLMAGDTARAWSPGCAHGCGGGRQPHVRAPRVLSCRLLHVVRAWGLRPPLLLSPAARTVARFAVHLASARPARLLAAASAAARLARPAVAEGRALRRPCTRLGVDAVDLAAAHGREGHVLLAARAHRDGAHGAAADEEPLHVVPARAVVGQSEREREKRGGEAWGWRTRSQPATACGHRPGATGGL